MATDSVIERRRAVVAVALDAMTVAPTEGTQALLPVEALTVDYRYQREPDLKRIESYSKVWDDVLAGSLIVNRRPDGRLVILDGQHRWLAARAAGVEYLRAVVYQIPPEQEPRYFVHFQTLRKPVSPYERHRAFLNAGDADAIAIQAVADRSQVKIRATRSHRSPAATGAVAALYQAYRSFGGRALASALHAIRLAWPDDDYGLSSRLIIGVAMFCGAFPEIGPDDLALKLSATTPRAIEARAKAIEAQSRAGIALQVMDAWNRGRRRRLIPEDLRGYASPGGRPRVRPND